MKTENQYDVAYRTKSGRLMVAKRIPGRTKAEAEKKLRQQMRASSTFDRIVATIKL